MKIRNFKIAEIILVCVLVVFSIWIVSNEFTTKINENSARYEYKIDSLKTCISNDSIYRLRLDSSIVILQDSIKMYQTRLESNNQKLTDLKTRTDEQLKKISKYSNNDVIIWINNRYGSSK
jgi:exonuclease VII small subunit